MSPRRRLWFWRRSFPSSRLPLSPRTSRPAPTPTATRCRPAPCCAWGRCWRAFARFLAFTPDGKTLVTCEGLGQQESVFRRWDAATGAEPRLPPRRPGAALRPSPDGKELALQESRASESIVFVRASDGKELRRIADTPPLMRVCYSPDGGLLAGVENNGAVHIWSVVNGEELPRGDAKNNDPAHVSRSPPTARRWLSPPGPTCSG